MIEALRDFTTDLHLLLDDAHGALDSESRAALEAWEVGVVPGLLDRAECEDGEIRIRIADGPTVAVAHLFLALGVVPRTRVAESIGCALEAEGYVRTA